MNPTTDLLRKIEMICRIDTRYKPEAYLFMLAALHFTVSQLPKRRHVSGKELLEGIRLHGLDQFGPLATQVFEHWGIEATMDFGHIVFSLVDAGLLGKTEEDSLEDFKDVFSFESAFNPSELYKLHEEV